MSGNDEKPIDLDYKKRDSRYRVLLTGLSATEFLDLVRDTNACPICKVRIFDIKDWYKPHGVCLICYHGESNKRRVVRVRDYFDDEDDDEENTDWEEWP